MNFLVTLSCLLLFVFSADAASRTSAMMTGPRLSRTNAVEVPYVPPEPGAWTNEWYVSTTGLIANSGTNISSPKPEVWAWTNPPGVGPGSTVWFLPGTYDFDGGRVNTTSGSGADWVTFRNYTNGFVRFDTSDTSLLMNNFARWSRFWGFTVTCSNPNGFTNTTANNQKPRGAGINEAGFTNQYIHLTMDGFGDNWSAFNSTGCVMYGCVILNAGWEYRHASDGSLGTGYGLYFHTPLPTDDYKIFEDNLFAPGMSHAVHSYSASVRLFRTKFIGNAMWCSGSLSTNRNMVANIRSGSGAGPSPVAQQGDFTIFDNVFYHDITFRGVGTDENLQLNHGTPNTNGYGLRMTNNVILGGRQPFICSDWNTNVNFISNILGGYIQVFEAGQDRGGYVFDRNFYSYDIGTSPSTFKLQIDGVGASSYTWANWTNTYGWDVNSTTNTFDKYFLAYPSNVLVRPSRYEANRANVFIANNRTNDNVLVNVSAAFANGTVVKVQNALNPRSATPHATLTVDGSGRISIPMTNLVNEVPFQTFQSSTGLPYNHRAITTNGTVAGFIVTLPSAFF